MLAEKGEVDLRLPLTLTAPVDSSQPASSTMLLLFSLFQGSIRVTPSVQPPPQPVRYAWPVGGTGWGVTGSEVTVGVPGKSCLWVSETEVIKPVVGSLGSRGTLPGGCGWMPLRQGHVLGSSWKPALSRILYVPA